LELRFPIPSDVGAKGVLVKFSRGALRVGLKSGASSESLLDAPLNAAVEVDDCTWYVEKGALVISLQKQNTELMWHGVERPRS
jgi:hypothetical protein